MKNERPTGCARRAAEPAGRGCYPLLIVFVILLLIRPAPAQTFMELPSQSATNTVPATNMWTAFAHSAAVYEVTAYNGSAGTLYLFVWDSATNKLTNAGYEIAVVPIPANSVGGYTWRSNGKRFVRGLTVAASTTPLTWTNGGNNFQISIDYTK